MKDKRIIMKRLLAAVLVLVLAAGVMAAFPAKEAFAAEKTEGSLNFREIELAPGSTEKLILTGAKAKSFKSSKKSVAKVSKKGIVTAKKAGNAKITVTDTNGKKYTCKITVKKSSLTIARTGIKADSVYVTGKYGSIEKKNILDDSKVTVSLVKPDGTVLLEEAMYKDNDEGLWYESDDIGFVAMDNGMILCKGKEYYKANGKKAFSLDFQKNAGFILKTTEFDNGVAVVRLGKLVDDEVCDYLIDEKGNVLVKIDKYEWNKEDEFFRTPSEGMTAYISEKHDLENDVWNYELLGYYDSKGKLIKVKTSKGKNYDYGWDFSDGLAAVEADGKIGFVDKTGKLVIPCEYTDFLSFDGKLFDNSMAVMAKGSGDDKKYGVIDKNNKTIIPFEYEYIYPVDNDFYVARKNGKYGIINKKNKTIVPIKYADFYDCNRLHQIITFVDNDGKYGVVDCKNNIILPFEYDDCWSSENGELILVCKDGKYGAVDYKGKTVIPFDYDDISSATEDGVIYAVKGDAYGFSDTTGDDLYIIKGAVK